ncbi:superinfection exclusion B family protein [Vreelandella sp. TE19]
MDFSKYTDWLKLPTKTLAALCIVAGILLFSGDELLSTIGLSGIVNAYRGYIGGAFLITLALVVVNTISSIWRFSKPWVVQEYWIWQGKKRLKSLTPDEKAILRFYIENQTRSQSLDIKSGTVNSLAKERIIYRGSSLGTMHGFDYIIQPWSWTFLNKHPELLDISGK